jgi:hypothetical protein
LEITIKYLSVILRYCNTPVLMFQFIIRNPSSYSKERYKYIGVNYGV